MKKLSLFLAFFLMSSWAAFGKPREIKLKSNMLSFRYEPYDEGTTVKCTQIQEDEFGLDWKVTCQDGPSKFLREYRVHLLLSRVLRESKPRASYELLYWVTEISTPSSGTAGNGPSLWFHFNNDAEWHSLSVGQQVESGTAGLYLDIMRPEYL